MKKVKLYGIGNMCRLCEEEKLAIMLRPEKGNLLNEKAEIISDCKHVKNVNWNMNPDENTIFFSLPHPFSPFTYFLYSYFTPFLPLNFSPIS